MRRIDFLTISLVFIFASLGGAPSGFAACEIDRSLSPCSGTHAGCNEAARRDFARYAVSEESCGVFHANRPYLLDADTRVPFRGTLVLVHGLTSTPRQMADLAEAYRKHGFNVVVPVLTGHGGTDALLTHTDVEEWKRDVHFAGQVARHFPGPLYLLGHSTGGVIGAIEAASAPPGMYKAIAGLDPALNLKGKNAAALNSVCLAKHFLKYPSQLPASLSPYGDEFEVEGFGSCRIGNMGRQGLRELIDFNVHEMVKRICGKEVEIPSFNREWTFASLCALKTATDSVTREDLDKLPPALVMLSRDQDIFGYISRRQMLQDLGNRPQNRIVQSEAPIHSVMIAGCSPGFDANLAETLRWFESHR